MKSPQWIFPRTKSPSSHTHRRPTLIAYLDDWRDAADDVEAASRRWRAASPGERADAALAFSAALEREETAAFMYQLAWEA
jgi:acyl-CoA reductase-like NAD-dependent aldehyde dehydrogenase